MSREVLVTLLLVVVTLGLNFLLWGTVGLLRFIEERVGPRRSLPPDHRPAGTRVRRRHLAVVMAAHNEEAVIVESLRSLRGLAPLRNVFVVSDGSTDATCELALGEGFEVLDLMPNRGKAGALRAALDHFGLLDSHRAVLFLDADTHLDAHYLDAALDWFDDPEIVAVAGYAKPIWDPAARSWMGRVIAAHRHRLYAVTQMLQKYGQTWRFTNVAYIVPGFASIYRTDTLRHIDMDPPGLVIEDFNMTFEIHRHRLGRIAFSPGAMAYCHEPGNYGDYVRQVQRWVLGFWQTVRRHGVWPSGFWAALSLWIIEIIVASVAFLLLPVVLLVLAIPELLAASAAWPVFGGIHAAVSEWVSLQVLAIGMLLPDVLLTGVLGVRDRRPLYPLLAVMFPVLRITDACIGLATIPRAWTQTSTGAWRSPSRT